MKAQLFFTEIEHPGDGRRQVTFLCKDKKLCDLLCLGTNSGFLEVEIDEKQFEVKE